jgi:hypothetical protein
MQFALNTQWHFKDKKWGRLRENNHAKLIHRNSVIMSYGEEIKASAKDILIYSIEGDPESNEVEAYFAEHGVK